MNAPDEPSRKQGHSKLVYDKERRTIVAVDPSPALAPDRAALVEEIEAFFRKWPSLANSTGDWSMLQRARDMIVADDDKIGGMSNSHAYFLQALSDIEDRNKRIAELEAKCSALEADARRLDWIGLQRARDMIVALTTAREELWQNTEDMERRIAELEAKCSALEAKYHELVYAVARKYPDETRHETALRYIRQREQEPHGDTGMDAALASQPPEGGEK